MDKLIEHRYVRREKTPGRYGRIHQVRYADLKVFMNTGELKYGPWEDVPEADQ